MTKRSPKIESEKPTLNDKELAYLEKLQSAVELATLTVDLETKTADNLVLRIKILQSEIALASQKIETLKQKRADRVAEKKDFTNTLQKKHGLPERWGYCPLSGEITTD